MSCLLGVDLLSWILNLRTLILGPVTFKHGVERFLSNLLNRGINPRYRASRNTSGEGTVFSPHSVISVKIIGPPVYCLWQYTDRPQSRQRHDPCQTSYGTVPLHVLLSLGLGTGGRNFINEYERQMVNHVLTAPSSLSEWLGLVSSMQPRISTSGRVRRVPRPLTNLPRE